MEVVDPTQHEDPGLSSHTPKKPKAKKKQLLTPAATPTSNVQTRSSTKRQADDAGNQDPPEHAAAVEDPSPVKKKRLFVPGTLGHGEKAAQVHPTSQPTLNNARARALARSTEPIQEVSASEASDQRSGDPLPPASTVLGGLAVGTPADTGKLSIDVTPEQFEFLRRLLGTSPQTGLLPAVDVKGKIPLQTPPSTPSKSVVTNTVSNFGPVAGEGVPSTPSRSKRLEGNEPFLNSPRGFPTMNIHDYDQHGQRVPFPCEVTDPDTQDPKLAEQYARLPRLRRCQLSSTSGEVPSQFFMFSQWVQNIPNISEPVVMSAVTFTQCGRNINLARIHPDVLSYKPVVSDTRERRELYVGDDVALCFTTVYVAVSNVETRSPVGQKRIVGVPHCQEVDRMAGVLGMVLNVSDFKVNFFQNGLSFTTYGNNAGGPGSSPSYKGCPSGMVSGAPRTQPKTAKLGTLRSSDPIYVFDARAEVGWEDLRFHELLQAFESTDNSLTVDKRMAELGFDLFGGEIPVGSCVVVAHTVNAGRPNPKGPNKVTPEMFNLNLNIQFAFLLGTPGGNGDSDSQSLEYEDEYD